MSIKQGTVKISELQSVKGKFSLAGKKAIVTGGARGFFLAVLVTCLIGLPTMVISCWRTKEGPRLRAAEHPVCRHVSRDVLDSGAERWLLDSQPACRVAVRRVHGRPLRHNGRCDRLRRTDLRRPLRRLPCLAYLAGDEVRRRGRPGDQRCAPRGAELRGQHAADPRRCSMPST